MHACMDDEGRVAGAVSLFVHMQKRELESHGQKSRGEEREVFDGAAFVRKRMELFLKTRTEAVAQTVSIDRSSISHYRHLPARK